MQASPTISQNNLLIHFARKTNFPVLSFQFSVSSFQFSVFSFSFQFPAFSFQLSVPGSMRQESFSSVQLQGGIQFPVFSFQLGAESVLYGTDSVRPPSDC